MADLMKVFSDFRYANIPARMDEMEQLLPAEFYIVEEVLIARSHGFRPALRFICETCEEGEEWIAKYVRSIAKKEEGKFSIPGRNCDYTMKYWTEIFRVGGKREKGAILAGIHFRIIKSDPNDIALRFLLLA